MRQKLALLAGMLTLAILAILPSAPARAQSYLLGANSYTNITTDATTVVKSGVGRLHTVCINTPAATETVQIYDNTAASGTKIGLVTEYASTTGCYTYDILFSTGLTIVTAVAAGDITVTWQ